MSDNPGIGRGMTAIGHHDVVSVMHIGLPWGDAEALAYTLDMTLTRHPDIVPPSYTEGMVALRDLLMARTRVMREATATPIDEYVARKRAEQEAR